MYHGLEQRGINCEYNIDAIWRRTFVIPSAVSSIIVRNSVSSTFLLFLYHADGDSFFPTLLECLQVAICWIVAMYHVVLIELWNLLSPTLFHPAVASTRQFQPVFLILHTEGKRV